MFFVHEFIRGIESEYFRNERRMEANVVEKDKSADHDDGDDAAAFEGMLAYIFMSF
jgi:hypothetical protein